MARIPGFHCFGQGSIPGRGTEILASHMARPKKKEKKFNYKKRSSIFQVYINEHGCLGVQRTNVLELTPSGFRADMELLPTARVFKEKKKKTM